MRVVMFSAGNTTWHARQFHGAAVLPSLVLLPQSRASAGNVWALVFERGLPVPLQLRATCAIAARLADARVTELAHAALRVRFSAHT